MPTIITYVTAKSVSLFYNKPTYRWSYDKNIWNKYIMNKIILLNKLTNKSKKIVLPIFLQ